MRKADKWSKVINFFFHFILKVYYITYLSKRVGFIHIFYDIWHVIFSGDSYSSIIDIKIILEKICMLLHKLNGLGNGATKIMEINTNIIHT